MFRSDVLSPAQLHMVLEARVKKCKVQYARALNSTPASELSPSFSTLLREVLTMSFSFFSTDRSVIDIFIT